MTVECIPHVVGDRGSIVPGAGAALCMYVPLLICVSVRVGGCVGVGWVGVCLFVRPSIHPSVCLCVCLSICLSVCLAVCYYITYYYYYVV